MSDNPIGPEMYFSYLKLKNTKCFGDEQTLDLKNTDGTISPWTLILGNNGLGKTTLLKCLVWMTNVEESDDGKKEEAGLDVNRMAIKPALDGLDDDEEYVHLARLGDHEPTLITAGFTLGVPINSKPTAENTIEYDIKIIVEKGELIDVKPKLLQVNEFVSPFIYAYSASRHMQQKNLDRSELSAPTSNLFSESGEIFDATEQLLFQDYAALQEKPPGKETALLKKIKKLLVDLLPGLNSPDDIAIIAKERTVKLRTLDGEISLDDLSLGYKTMVAWTVDLALKMLASNPDSDEPLEMPAVVIIDEVDLHLHPKWQRVIQKRLTDTFKRTQFICTAHSPFMAQSSESENLCILKRRGNEVVIINDPYIVRGWRIGQIITSDLFGVPDTSPDVEDLFEERQQLLDNFERSDAQNLRLTELDRQIDSLPFAESEQELQILDRLKKTAEFLNDEGKLL